MMVLYRVKHIVWTEKQEGGMRQWGNSHRDTETQQEVALIRLWINAKWTIDATGCC
jgi:hypothetical protein